MNLEEAYAVLGVSEDADAKAIRRAYHELLKRHKPDVDPAGFRRVRDAFEVASSRARIAAGREAAVADDDPAATEDISAPVPPDAETPAASTRVWAALDEGRIDDAIELVNAPTWSDVLLDDEDGDAWWATATVAKAAVLANRPAFDALSSKYPDVMRTDDLELGVLLVVSSDWEHLRAHHELPEPLVDIVLQSPYTYDEARQLELGRALGAWYWNDPSAAWDVLTATLSNHGALGPYVLELIDDYDELVQAHGCHELPLDGDARPRDVLRPLTLPVSMFTLAVVVGTWLLFLPEDADRTELWMIVGRHVAAIVCGVFALSTEVFAYRMWPSIRRRYLHACLAHDVLPEDAAFAITGHVFLQHALRNDIVLMLAHRVSRLARLP